MMFKFYAAVCFILIGQVLFGQNYCQQDVDPKALKLYEKGSNKKKYDKSQRLQFLREAIEIQDDYADANFLLAIERIKTARAEGSSFKTALRNLEIVAQVCPNYHADVYYYIGAIYMGQQQYAEAIKYQEKFIKFQSEDETRFPKDYLRKIDETKEDYAFAKFYADSYANPVLFNPEKVLHLSTAEADEYLPIIAPDNEAMYFTRKSQIIEQVKTSLIASDKPREKEEFVKSNYSQGIFDLGQAMEAPFNTNPAINYGGASISIDNKEIILTICKMANIPNYGLYKNCDLYSTAYVFAFHEELKMDMWYWTEPKNLGENVNTLAGWESQPSLSGDGKTLFYASIREGTEGIDIFYTERQEDGSWGKAKPVGAPINTPYNDKSPFIHSDSQTLYYATEGNIGFGGYDIFMSKKSEDGTWSTPKNLGYPINSEDDEHGFIVATNGRDAYFSSDKVQSSSYGFDIYKFELYKEVRPEKVAFVKGSALDELGEPIKGATVKLKNSNSSKTEEFKVDENDGKYAGIIKIEENDKVVLSVETEEKTFNSRLVNTESNDDGTYEEVEVLVEKIESGKAFTLNDIYYATNSAEISEDSKLILNEFAEFLIENENIKVEIRGHTDNVGKVNDNVALSNDRAFSVMAYLQSKGVSKQRLSFKGFGPSMPIADNSSEKGRALNRRTEFFILSK